MAWVGALISVAGTYLASQDSGDAAQSAADTSAKASNHAADVQKQMYDQTRQDQLPWMQRGNLAGDRLNYLLGLSPQGGPKTKDQLIAELTPQFTKTSSLSTPMSPLSYYMAGGTYYGGAGPSSATKTTLDQAGLNAAVNAELAKQKAQASDPAYGSLMRAPTLADIKADPVYQNGLQFGLSEGEKGLNRLAAANGSMLSGATLKALTRYGNDYGTTKSEGAYNRVVNNQTNEYNRLAGISGTGQTQANALGQEGSNYANSIGNISMLNGQNQGNAMLAGANARAAGYQGVANSLGKVDWSKLFSSSGGGGDAGGYTSGGY